MKVFQQLKSGRLRIAIAGFLAVFALYTVFGFFILPRILKPILSKEFSKILQQDTSIKKISINPYLLSVALKGIDVKEKDGQKRFAFFGEIRLDLQATSLFKQAFIFKEIAVKKSQLNIERVEAGRFNIPVLPITTILRLTEAGFVIKKMKATDGTIKIFDIPQKKEHIIKNINVTVPRVSNLKGERDEWTEIFYDGGFNKSRIHAKIKTKLFSESLDTLVDLKIKGLRLSYYQPYIPARLGFNLSSGNLDVEGKISFSRKEKPELELSGNLIVRELEVADKKDNRLLKLPYLEVGVSSFRPFSKQLHISGVSLTSPEISLMREKEGNINLSGFLFGNKSSQGKGNKQPFSFSIDKVEVTAGKIYFSDFFKKGFSQTTSKPEGVKAKSKKAFRPFFVQAKDIDLTIQNLSNAKESKADFSISLRPEQKGSLSARGTLSVKPVSLDLKLEMKGVELKPFEPYILKGTKARLTRGSASADGDIHLEYSKEKGLVFSYLGNASLLDFASIDTVTKRDFIKWKILEMHDISISNKPSLARIKDVVLQNFFARFEVTKEGKLNTTDVLDTKKKEKGFPEQTPKAVKKTGPPFKSIIVDKTIIQNGNIKFFDNYIEPHFRANITDIGGIISNISPDAEKLANVNLKGKLDKTTPLEINGQINPLSENLSVNLTIDFKNFDMTSVSPYARKYLGYTIKKGQFSFNAKYVIVNKKLESENSLFFDKLTLGEKVESPHATTLPVELTISLLKNRKGEIRFDMPVRGRTDDPEFDPVKVVFKTIRNFFSKAATSPFSVLGAFAGSFAGAEELRYIEFDPGSNKITNQSRDKLDFLAKALQERPGPHLEIEGYVDKENDREALKQKNLMKKLKEQKLKEDARKGTTLSLEEVKISPQEYQKYLKKAYIAETSEHILGRIFVEDLTQAQMEKVLLERITISDNDLGTLAKERAKNVKGYLTETGKLEPKRLFLVKPKTLSPEEQKGLKESRVNLRLK